MVPLAIALIMGQVAFSEEPVEPAPSSLPVPVVPEVPSPLEIGEVVILRPEPNLGDRQSHLAKYRVIAKVTNRGSALIVHPVLRVSLDSSPEHVEGCVAGFMIFPGETKVFCTGGFWTTPEILNAAVTAKLDLESKDHPYEHSGYWRQIEFLHALSFTEVSFKFFPTNHDAVVKGVFQNFPGLRMKLLSGTAVFLDDEGHLVGAGLFVYDPQQTSPEKGVNIGLMPGIEKATRCEIQVDYFQEE